MKNKILKIGLALLVVALMVTSNVFIATNPNLSAKFQKILTIGMSGVAYAETPDYTCDGAEDNVQVKEALDALPATGGKLVLFAGDYDFHATVLRAIPNVCIEGGGYATYVNAGATAVFSDGGQVNWVFKNFRTGTGGITYTGTGSMILGCWINTSYQDDMVYGSRGVTVYVFASDALNKPSATVAGLYYVCTGTNDQDVINTAIAALPAGGGRIVLSEGIFSCASADSGDRITAIANLTIEGQGIDVTEIVMPTTPAYKYLFYYSGTTISNVIFKGFTVDVGNDAGAKVFAFNLEYVDYLTIENVKVTSGANKSGNNWIFRSDHTKILDCRFNGTGVQLAGNIGASLDDAALDSTDALVQGCIWTNPPTDGFCIGNLVKGFKVIGCDFRGDSSASFSAIDLCFSPDAVITNNTVDGFLGGIYVEGARGTVISSNTVTNCKQGIGTSESPDGAIQATYPDRPGRILITDNTIRGYCSTGGDQYGIFVLGIPRVSILNNKIEDSGKYGIFVYQKTVSAVVYTADYCVIAGNYIIDYGNGNSWGDGVLIDYATGCAVEGNYIDGKSRASESAGIAMASANAVSTVCIDNTIINCSGGTLTDNGTTSAIRGNTGYHGNLDVDDTPVDGATTAPISSNWAYDYGAAMGTSLDANDFSLSGSTLRLDRDRNIILTAGGGWATTTAGCAYSTLVESTTNKENIWYADFDKDTDENMEWSIVLPNDFATDGTATITAQFVWTAASGSGNVTWACKWISYGDNEVIDAAYGTAQSVTDTLQTANYKHVSPATAAITGAGTPAAGEFAQIRVYRDVSEDGLTADARLMSVILTYHGK